MTRIVLATCNLWPEVSTSDRLYAEAIEARGAQVTAAPWNGPQGLFRAADLVVLRSNWDYHHEPSAFALWLELLTRAGTSVLNPPDMALWNMHKRYLLALEEHGVRVPQTRVADFEAESIRRAFQDLGGAAAVVKPAIGASGFHVYKVSPRNLDEVIARVQAGLPGRPLLVQEFLPEIADGERSFVFIDGEFCHLLRRQPDTARRLDHDNDEPEFRANGVHGSTITLAEAEPGAVAQARSVLDTLAEILYLSEPPLYARADGVFRDGRFILTELELNEPSLGLNLHPPTAERFADATLRRLGHSRGRSKEKLMSIRAQGDSTSGSLATCQRSLGDPSISYPLMPPLTSGCPRTSTEDLAYPVEVEFDYARVNPALFDQPPLPGLERWAPLLPPLAPAVAMQDGGTPLVDVPAVAAWAGFDGGLYVKDESRNPTWSHKDRLNLCTVSAAVLSGAPGVIVASSGNHGAAAAAHAARAGLPCIVITSPVAPASVLRFLLAYGAAVVTPPSDYLASIRQIVERLGYMPMGNLTATHTGHPFGPEGYKTIAYETFLQLGRRVPAAVFVPTGYGELLSGVWKGFRELRDLGLADRAPAIVACEPAVLGPLARAVREGRPAATVPSARAEAYAIACTVNGYRSVLTVRESGGAAMTVTDAELHEARRVMGQDGLWPELSSAAGVAAFRQAVAAGQRFNGPVVCISTSNGFKDLDSDRPEVPQLGDDWGSVKRALRQYGLPV